MTTSPPPLDAMGEFKHSVWRIVTYAADEGTRGYLLSEAQVDEITAEAHEYARGLAEAECAQAVSDALLALAADFDTQAAGYEDRWVSDTAETLRGAARLARQRAGEAPGTGHRYLSTSCLHGKHDYCKNPVGSNGTVDWAKTPASCKFCPALCICWCHASPSVPVPGPQDSSSEPAAVSPVSREGGGAQEAAQGRDAAIEAVAEVMPGLTRDHAALVAAEAIEAAEPHLEAAYRAKVQHAIDHIAQTAAAAQEKAVGTAVAAERRRFAAVLKAIAEHCDDADFEASLDLLRDRPVTPEGST
jgi:hypothetical protein